MGVFVVPGTANWLVLRGWIFGSCSLLYYSIAGFKDSYIMRDLKCFFFFGPSGL